MNKNLELPWVHVKCSSQGLAMKQRHKVTRNWPINYSINWYASLCELPVFSFSRNHLENTEPKQTGSRSPVCRSKIYFNQSLYELETLPFHGDHKFDKRVVKLATNGWFLFLVQWQSERILWLRSKFQPLDWKFLTLKLWKKLPNELQMWKMIWLETSELTVTLWRLIVYSFVRSPTKLMQ